MPVVRIRGDIPNLTLIREDISSALAANPDVDVLLVAAPPDSDSLGHAEWGELALHAEAVLDGLVTTAIWSSLAAAVKRARRRGQIHVSVPEELAAIEGLQSEPINPADNG